MLCEGVGVRATARIVGCNRNTVLSVLETVGAKCVSFLDRKLRNLAVSSLQIDELWSKVGLRQIRTIPEDTEHGDFYTFLALEARTKLIMAYHTGKRDYANTDAFIEDMADRIVGRVQITCDGWSAYPATIRKYLLERLDLAVVIKIFGQEGAAMLDSVRRYSPPVCTGTMLRIRAGSPRRDRISTSYVERVNLSVRTFNRRFTRLAMGYSKKLLNHKFSVALFVAHYNFCKLHSTLGTSPAHGQQLTDHLWTTEELIQNLSETI
jgi:IS1 family transposase